MDERAPGLRRGRLAATLARRALGADGPGGDPAAAGPPSPERKTEEEKALAKAAEMRAKAKAKKEKDEGG